MVEHQNHYEDLDWEREAERRRLADRPMRRENGPDRPIRGEIGLVEIGGLTSSVGPSAPLLCIVHRHAHYKFLKVLYKNFISGARPTIRHSRLVIGGKPLVREL